MPEVVSLLIDGPRSIACRRSEPGELPADSVRVEAIVTGVSAGTERMWFEGTNPAIASGRRGYPYAPGYEFVGRVTEIGKDATGVELGEHVFAMKPHASEAILRPSDFWTPLPGDLDPDDALAIALTATNLHTLHRVRPEAGDNVAVIGLGALGFLCCQVLRATGAGQVIAVSRSARKRALALELGADATFDTLDPDLEAKVKECTGGRGADVAIEWAGATEAVTAAMQTVRNQGDVVVGGFHVTPFSVSGEVLFSKELRLHGVRGSGNTQPSGEFNRWSRRENLTAATALVSSGAVRGKPLVTHRIPAPDLSAAYEATGAAGAHFIQVVLDWARPTP